MVLGNTCVSGSGKESGRGKERVERAKGSEERERQREEKRRGITMYMRAGDM